MTRLTTQTPRSAHVPRLFPGLFPSHSMPVIDIALYEPSTYRAYTRPFLILYAVAGWWLHSCAAYSSCSIRVHTTSSTRRSSQTMARYLFFFFSPFFSPWLRDAVDRIRPQCGQVDRPRSVFWSPSAVPGCPSVELQRVLVGLCLVRSGVLRSSGLWYMTCGHIVRVPYVIGFISFTSPSR